MKSLIAETWAQRAQAELGAEARFEALGRQMIALRTPNQILRLVRKARDDEARHARLCAAVARHYGHESGFEAPPGVSRPLNKSWLDLNDHEDRLLCEVVLMCCITETINAGLLDTISLDLNTSTRTGRVIRSILDDEVRHGQIGWAFVAAQTKKRDCGFLSEFLGEMLEISVRDELFLPVQDRGVEPVDTMPDGVLPLKLRLGQFCSSLESLVMPGLEHFGIDTGPMQHWLEAKLSAPMESLVTV